MAVTLDVRVKRIYEPSEPTDGKRVLVDRLWPRGVSKARADLYEWCKDVAPSTDLRTWYDHDPAKFDQFRQRYLVELVDLDHITAYQRLRELASSGTLTLLTASRAVDISEAAVLQSALTRTS